MSILASLGLTREQIRALASKSAPKPTPAPIPERLKRSNPKARGTMKRTVPAWIWEWIASLEDDTEFTLDDVMEKCGKIRPTAQTAISLAVKRGLVAVQRRGTPGTGIRQFTRTESTNAPRPHESPQMARIRALKPGTVVDYLTIKATSAQAAIHMLRRGAQAGLLKPAEWRVRSGTVYRKVTK